jgi:fructose/tagatose bisphosphate aldolase
MIYENMKQMYGSMEGILRAAGSDVQVLSEEKLRKSLVDDLVCSAVFSPDAGVREAAIWVIRRTGASLGILSSSIQGLYEALGKNKVSGFTVPAINLRGLTYESAQAVFRAALRGKVGPVLFEIARSEIGYTEQRPREYAAVVTAAAVKTGYRGPLFLQGDHFQVSGKKFASDPKKEVDAVRELIREAIAAGFYNIDIDSSTVVDLSKPTIKEQQRNNFSIAAELTALIRRLEPKGITVSVGGEIGEVGGKNSTVEELRCFMDHFLEELEKKGKGLKGLSKMSIQTGTTHGGVVLPDGTISKVSIDFDTLERISRAAREEYGLAGAVQHGASTLPDEAFDRFPRTGTAEIHLATGFQNIILDSPRFPAGLREKLYGYVKTNLADERSAKDTEEQFIYKTRKKVFGPFKQELWNLPGEVRQEIGRELEEKFYFLFEKLNVLNTAEIVRAYVHPVDVPLVPPKREGAADRPSAAERYDEGE